MKDPEIFEHIDQLVKEEHDLLERGESGSLSPSEHERLSSINVRLDQYWDLLRQRRARRDAGEDPGIAEMRSADVVEHYKQ
jgi:uncharacterized protein DUF2630